jgi:hypothetical protein
MEYSLVTERFILSGSYCEAKQCLQSHTLTAEHQTCLPEHRGFLSLNPLAFTHVPPSVTASKLTARTACLEIQFAICVDRFMVLFQ